MAAMTSFHAEKCRHWGLINMKRDYILHRTPFPNL